MGTITRTFANNITTSGVFKPTAFNDASFDNVTAVPEGALPAGGNMVLLSTQTASGDASISFTTGIDSTYKEYMFVFNNIHPANNSVSFQFNLSTDGGSSYNVTKTTTHFMALHNEGDEDASVLYYSSLDLAQSSSYQTLGFEIGNVADESFSGTLQLFEPSSNTFVKHFTANNNYYNDADRSFNSFVSGYGNTTSAINAVDFKFGHQETLMMVQYKCLEFYRN
jgi:hypothetical protein